MTGGAYFDDLYARSADPWGLASEPYEHRKHALTVAVLPRTRYRRAFEPGCAIGVLTALLAERCDELVAWDPAAAAVDQVRERVRDPHVWIERAGVPQRWPDGSFDLVVVSELLYFLAGSDRADVYAKVHDSLRPGGHLVAVHWRHAFDEAAGTGDEAHQEIARTHGLHRLVDHVERDFLLGVWERTGA